MKLLVVGSAIVDLVARPAVAAAADSSNDADIRLGAGGAGRNVAENLQRLGCAVTLVTDLGDDALGLYLRADAAALGIDVRVCSQPRTGLYLALLHPGGGLDRGYCQTATDQISAAQVLELLPDLGEFAGVVLDANLSEACITALAARCRTLKIPYALETAAHQRCTRVLAALPGCALIKPDRGEATALTGLPCATASQALACAQALHQRGAATALVSLGADGFCVASGDFVGHVPAAATPVVDVTGAGDALFAAAWVGLLRGLPLAQVLRAASQAAALACASEHAVSRALTPQLFELA